MKPTPRSSKRQRIWDKASVEALGTTTDVETAGEILGIGRTTAYRLASLNEFPVTVLRVGDKPLYRIPVASLLATVFPNTPQEAVR